MEFGVVILAAGRSSRMRSPKLLLEWGGKSLLRRAVETAGAAGATEIVVVLGDHADLLSPQVPAGLARMVRNPDFEQGQSTSLRRGLAALAPHLPGAVCYPADQPFVTAAVIRRLVSAYQRSGRPAVVSEAAGVRGAPVFFSRGVFSDLMRIEGDQGAREFVRSHPELVQVERFDDPSVMLDVDTPEDYQALLELTPPSADRS